MLLTWSAFVTELKSAGYDGKVDDLAGVQRWLKSEGHDHQRVDVGSGEMIELEDLYNDRAGKPFDASSATAKAEFDAKVTDKVRSEIEDMQARGGFRLQKGRAINPHEHDVKVGEDRLTYDKKGGFDHAGDFYSSVMRAGMRDGGVSEKLEVWNKAALSTYGSEGSGADGGFAVPPEFRAAISSKVTGEDSLISRTDQIPLSTNAITFPDDETTPWQTSGGIQAYWEGEAGTLTQSKPALKMKELKLRKITALVPVTEELMEDSTAMGAYVTRKAGEKIDFRITDSLINGTGAGQPLGVLNSACTISIAKESSQAATSILGANIRKMWTRMYGPYRAGAVWLINQDVEPELMRLSDIGRNASGGGTSAWGTFLYVPAGGYSSAPYGTLMGRPVITTQACATLGTVGDILLCNWQQYVTAIKSGGVESQTSIHLWFDQDAIAFKFRMRVDGQPWLSAAISPKNGSNTLSSFLSLATRA